MSDVMKPASYGVRVRDLWVAVDFEAGAVSVTRLPQRRSARTEELGNGFLVDRTPDGTVYSVEILGTGSDAETKAVE